MKEEQQEFSEIAGLKTPTLSASSHNLEAFCPELYEGLELILNSPKDNPSNNEPLIHPPVPDGGKHFDDGFSIMNLEILDFIGKTKVFEDNLETPVEYAVKNVPVISKKIISLDDGDENQALELSTLAQEKTENQGAILSLSHQEENMMLKHFFRKLLPLLDAHPDSPWPSLALKYCDFNIARSCFISLACIHIYESRKGGNEYYQRGLAHINNAMNHLIKYLSVNKDDVKKTEINSYMVLVLINVHILFSVLEKGTSNLSRFFYKVFASLCQESDVYGLLMENDSQRLLVIVLSWYDTISAIVSPDCRLPFCSPSWYGVYTDSISSIKMMGCPGEILRAISKVCLVRHELYSNKLDSSSDRIQQDYRAIKLELMSYREFVPLGSGGASFNLTLKGAQCWSLAGLICLTRTVKPPSWRMHIQRYIHEFVDVYGSMDPISPTVTQMVWPVYAVGCECTTDYERHCLLQFMDKLYTNAQMGTLYTLKQIVLHVWELGLTQEEVLSQWLKEGQEYLPL